MARCQMCQKKTVIGRNVSHAENRTPRRFGANIQKITFYLHGAKKTMNLCTKCIKKLSKSDKFSKIPPKKAEKKKAKK